MSAGALLCSRWRFICRDRLPSCMRNTVRSLQSCMRCCHCARGSRRDRRVDPKVFRAILYYLDVFLEREHHHKEEAVLFPRIRQRTRDADAVLDQLACEHESGEEAIRDLEQASCATRSMAPPNSDRSPKQWTDTSNVTASTCGKKNVK